MIYKSRFTAKPKNVGVDIHLREVEWEDVDWIYLAHDIGRMWTGFIGMTIILGCGLDLYG